MSAISSLYLKPFVRVKQMKMHSDFVKNENLLDGALSFSVLMIRVMFSSGSSV